MWVRKDKLIYIHTYTYTLFVKQFQETRHARFKKTIYIVTAVLTVHKVSYTVFVDGHRISIAESG